MRAALQALLFAITLFGVGVSVHASTVSLIPTGPTQVSTGDIVTLNIVLDFSDVPNGTLGGGFDIAFDPSALGFVEAIDIQCISFSCGPDIQDGLLFSWGVGDFNGLAADGPELVAAVRFEILPTFAFGTDSLVTIGGTDGFAGPWVSADDFVTILHPAYNDVVLTRVPLPAAAWCLFSGLVALLRVRHRG